MFYICSEGYEFELHWVKFRRHFLSILARCALRILNKHHNCLDFVLNSSCQFFMWQSTSRCAQFVEVNFLHLLSDICLSGLIYLITLDRQLRQLRQLMKKYTLSCLPYMNSFGQTKQTANKEIFGSSMT